MTKKILSIFLVISIFMPSLSLAFELPKDADESQELLEKGIEVGKEELPSLIENIWTNEVLPIWGKMYNWFKNHIWPIFFDWFQEKVEPELERLKPNIEEEFDKERTEIKEELPKVGNSLWNKFKEIIK